MSWQKLCVLDAFQFIKMFYNICIKITSKVSWFLIVLEREIPGFLISELFS